MIKLNLILSGVVLYYGGANYQWWPRIVVDRRHHLMSRLNEPINFSFTLFCDVDGCVNYGCGCSCKNLENGEFECGCEDGEILDADEKSCIGKLSDK